MCIDMIKIQRHAGAKSKITNAVRQPIFLTVSAYIAMAIRHVRKKIIKKFVFLAIFFASLTILILLRYHPNLRGMFHAAGGQTPGK